MAAGHSTLSLVANPLEVLMKRLLVKLGYHGKSHKAKTQQLLVWMHLNGLGA